MIAAQRRIVDEAVDSLSRLRHDATRLGRAQLTLVAGAQRAGQTLASIGEQERAAAAALRRVDDVVARRRAALRAARLEQAADERRYAELRAEADQLRQHLRSPGAGGAGAAATVAGRLDRPVAGPVTSSYGMRVHPITGADKLHTGTDFRARCGTTVAAAAAGAVIQAGFSTAYGHRIVVRHGVGADGGRLTTTYNHLSWRAVSAGSTVRRGEVLGRSGTTGYSTGCHLHFEVLLDGEFVDPVPWLAGRSG